MRKLLILVLISSCFSSCFTEKRAHRTLSRVAVSYPELLATYFADKYKIDTVVIKGDSVIRFDTIYAGSDTVFDTILIQNRYDFVTITFKKDSINVFHLNEWKTIYNKGERIITKTVKQTDTIFRENKAGLDVVRYQVDRLTKLLESTVAEKNKYKGRSRNYLWIIIALSALLIASNYAKLKRLIPVIAVLFLCSCHPSKRNTLPVYVGKTKPHVVQQLVL